MKQGLVMEVLVEPLPTFAGPSNEEVTLFHSYRLNGEKTAVLVRIDYVASILNIDNMPDIRSSNG